jgi:hypothetical protein
MRIIATPLVLGLQGVDADRTYLLASSEDSEGGASRSYMSACTRSHQLPQHTPVLPPPPAMKLPCECLLNIIAPPYVLGLQGGDVDRLQTAPLNKRKYKRGRRQSADISGAPSVTNYRTAQRDVTH